MTTFNVTELHINQWMQNKFGSMVSHEWSEVYEGHHCWNIATTQTRACVRTNDRNKFTVAIKSTHFPELQGEATAYNLKEIVSAFSVYGGMLKDLKILEELKQEVLSR